jgi:hypothetical protein
MGAVNANASLLVVVGAALVACGPYEGAPPPETPPSSAPAPVAIVFAPADGTPVEVTATVLPSHWRGEWSTPTGYRCSFDLELQGDAAGVLAGRFRWTLLDAPADSSQRVRIGKTASEWVRGRFDPIARELHLVGYEVDDPQLLITDEYKLALDASGVAFTGKSRGQLGLWRDELRGGAID